MFIMVFELESQRHVGNACKWQTALRIIVPIVFAVGYVGSCVSLEYFSAQIISFHWILMAFLSQALVHYDEILTFLGRLNKVFF